MVGKAPALLIAATGLEYQAIGFEQNLDDTVHLETGDASLGGIDAQLAADTIIFAATLRAVDNVTVAEQVIVQDGIHLQYDEVRQNYENTLRELSLL